MCCIFTCCGWVMDLFQRFWTFAMSCFISSAVCCAFITAAMSGVALGYNYSLAEYIENKETNVSVYLKRGVFDDEVVNELDWRRGGGGPPPLMEQPLSLERSGEEANPQSQITTNQYFPERRAFDVTTAPDEDIVLSPTPGRRLDDSIIQSDDSHRFEGALLKFTGASANLATTKNPYPNQDITSVKWNSEDFTESLKDLQAQINAYRMRPLPEGVISTPAYAHIFDPNYQPDFSTLDMLMPQSARRMLVPETPAPELSLRNVKPVIDKNVWRDPQPHRYIPQQEGFRDRKVFTPPPIPFNILGPIAEFKSKLSTPEPKLTKKQKARPPPPTLTTKAMPFVMDLEEEFSTRGIADILKKMREPPEEKDYDEDEVKGLPVRKRRNINNPDIDSVGSKKPDSYENVLRTSEKERANKSYEVKDGLFDKLALTVLNNCNNLRASESSKSEVHNVETTVESTTIRERIYSGEKPIEEIVTSMVNSFSVTPFPLKIIKSTIIS